MPGAKEKSGRQVRFLFSKGSPLDAAQKSNLASEIRSGEVKIKGSMKPSHAPHHARKGK